jgi:phage gp36-like protein
MAYCTLADIKAHLPDDDIIQLTDDENFGAVNQARVNEAIATADAEIDGYCAVRYAVPLSPVPSLVAKLSVEIAIYYLHARRGAPEKIEKRYDKAVSRLKDISRGLLTLGVDPAPAASVEASGAATNKTDSDRVFTRERMRGY